MSVSKSQTHFLPHESSFEQGFNIPVRSDMMSAMLKSGNNNGKGRAGSNGHAPLLRDGLRGLGGVFSTILADPPWRFANRTGKMAPEHKRLARYETMSLEEICALPVAAHAESPSHLYLWVPNALLPWGLQVMGAWGFTYKTNIVWYKVRKDGGPDGRGVGFYFRNVTELLLFGIKGRMRTLKPGRTQVNLLSTRKEEHSRKPAEMHRIIEACSPGPYLELFARERVTGWQQWGDEVDSYMKKRPLRKGYNDRSPHSSAR